MTTPRNEQEEFEFRLRAEQEAAARNLAAPAKPQGPEQSFGENLARGALGSLAGLGSNLARAGTYIPRKVAGMMGVNTQAVDDYLDRMSFEAKAMQDSAKGVGGFIGGTAVDLAGTGGFGGIAKAGLGRVASMLPNATRTVKVLTAAPTAAAVEGAMGGAYLAPEGQLAHAGMGAAGGVAGQQLLSRTLGRIAKPVKVTNADAEALMHEGVPLTVGFASDPNTLLGKSIRFLEESAAGVPGAGAGVKAQREAARAGFRDIPLRLSAEQAKVPPPVRSVGKSTRDLADELGESIGNRYEHYLQGRNFRPTGVFRQNIDSIILDPKLSMTEVDRIRARSLVEAHLFDRMKGPAGAAGPMPQRVSADEIFKAQSDLRKLGERARDSNLSSEQAYGEALVRSADEVYKALRRQYPRAGQELINLKPAYATLSTTHDAMRKVPGGRGEFSPVHLAEAADKRGNDYLRHLSTMAEPLLTRDPGMMGTTARTSLLLGGGYMFGPWSLPIVAGLHAGLGTRTGQRTLLGQNRWQQALADALERNASKVDRSGAFAGRELATDIYDSMR